MRFNSKLISSFLFASVALAGRFQSRQSLVEKPANASSDTYLSNWAGAVYEMDSGFHFISGTVTVPHISGPINSGSRSYRHPEWPPIPRQADVKPPIHICLTFVLLLLHIAWCNFADIFASNGDSHLNVAISAGDLIRFTVQDLDTTTGLVVVENLSNGQTDNRQLQSSEPLCGLSAEWVVELVPGVDNWLPLANFSPVTFTEAAALDNNGQAYWPQGANITEIHTKDGPVTSVSLGENSVTINYA
ncbi:peptidase A4 family-domain-containing protein [Boletus edulis]|nr:peptidase A4 family-domain-containing protein [Boletus edulis]